MFLDVFGTYRAQIGSRSRPIQTQRPHWGTFSTEPQAWKTIQSHRATWMQSDLPHGSGLQKRVSICFYENFGDQTWCKIETFDTHTHIICMYIIRRTTPISGGCTYSEWETGQWRRQSVENWGPRARFPRFPRLRARNNCNHFASDLCWALLRPGPIRNQESPAGRCFSGLSVENSWQFQQLQCVFVSLPANCPYLYYPLSTGQNLTRMFKWWGVERGDDHQIGSTTLLRRWRGAQPADFLLWLAAGNQVVWKEV